MTSLFRYTIQAITLTLFLSVTLQLQGQDFSVDQKSKMQKAKRGYGIEGQPAPELSTSIEWISGDGKAIDPIQLSDLEGKVKVIYGFQSWCPGCHSVGLPSLKKMVDALEGSDKVEFFAIQTVFEGSHSNTKDKLVETQERYGLDIPFGHDTGNSLSNNRSITMNDYRTGGTPWFIFIDQEGKVLFNDYHINVDKAIAYLKTIN